jgi:hypothetical protein
MQTMGTTWSSFITSMSRTVKGKVELYKGSTLSGTFYSTDLLSSIKIEKTPTHGNFFGYSICQKATVELLDKDGSIDIVKGDKIKPYIGATSEGFATEYADTCYFIVDEVVRDEVKKIVSVTAYDLLNEAKKHTQNELNITFPITIRNYADAVASILGTTIVWEIGNKNFYNFYYTEAYQPNFEGTETLRDVLDALAQASGTVCFVKYDNTICFKRINLGVVSTIQKRDYFSLKISKPLTLTKVTSATQLGDNLSSGTEDGYNQIFYDNPFIELHPDNEEAIEDLLDCVSGSVIYPYEIKWRGNPAFEIGDRLTLTLEDDSTVDIVYLGETIKYTGGLSATSEWKEKEQESVHSTPTTIGEAIKQTYAKVDKVNKQIDIVASESSANAEAIASLQLNTESITLSVDETNKSVNDAIENFNSDIEELNAELKLTKNELTLDFTKQINDKNEITTATGYRFDADGLTVSKSGSEITTQITEDGMTVSKGGTVVLTANNIGVDAENLHATTYLIIGENSRFEDYGTNRTGCFWIGG